MRTGDRVHVASFGKGVVREVRNGGRVLVEVKGRSMLVDADRLTPLDPVSHPAHAFAQTPIDLQPAMSRQRAPASIDLHRMTVEQALSAIDEFLNDAMLAGLPEVQIIHGRSGGRLRHAVHRRLGELPTVRGFRTDRSNPGVTIVTL